MVHVASAMSHGMRWPSELDVLKTTARIVDTTGCAIPKAVGKYPGGPLYPLVQLCRDAGLPEPIPEYVFHPTRKWRFDYAIPQWKVAVEIEGGIWTQGRHTRGQGFLDDLTKYNAAACMGWRVLRYPPHRIANAVIDLQRVA